MASRGQGRGQRGGGRGRGGRYNFDNPGPVRRGNNNNNNNRQDTASSIIKALRDAGLLKDGEERKAGYYA